jgi:hypothetical protein
VTIILLLLLRSSRVLHLASDQRGFIKNILLLIELLGVYDEPQGYLYTPENVLSTMPVYSSIVDFQDESSSGAST